MAISSADAIKAIAAIEKQLAALRVFAGMPAEAVAVKSKPAASTEKPESKRVLSPHIVRMNEERAAVFEELKEAWALANPDFASLDDKAYKQRAQPPPLRLPLLRRRWRSAAPPYASAAPRRRGWRVPSG